MLTPKDTPPFLCDINSTDALDENFDDSLEEAFSHFEEFFQNDSLSASSCAEKEAPSSETDLLDKKSILAWPYDAQTGENLPWGTPLKKGKVVTYAALQGRWPHDSQTGRKLPWGTALEKGKVVTYAALQGRWPYDAQTGRKLPWGTPLKKGKVIACSALQARWPHDARTGEKLPWGTPLEKGKVIIYMTLKNRWPYDTQTGKKLPWGTALEKDKVISYGTLQNRWPHDARTGEKLPWETPLEKGKVVTYGVLKAHWPHDARTGERLSIDAKIDKKNIVTYSGLFRMRPTNKLTGNQLPYGTKFDGNVIKLYEFKMHYTFVGSDGKTYKGLNAKEKAAKENPGLFFKSKQELKSEKERSLRKKKSFGDVLAIKENPNPRKRSKQSSMEPEGSSSCINIPTHQQSQKSILQFLPLVPEDYNINHEVEKSLEFEPLSPIFLPGLAQPVPNSNTNLNLDIEECGLSPSILLFGPGG